MKTYKYTFIVKQKDRIIPISAPFLDIFVKRYGLSPNDQNEVFLDEESFVDMLVHDHPEAVVKVLEQNGYTIQPEYGYSE